MSEHNENIVILEEPIKRGDTLITQIEIIKPNAGHLRGIGLAALANADVDALTVILPRITVPNLTAQDCKSLNLPDLIALAGKVIGFLSPKSEQ
ncbi:phage tail assembly protein [Rahnella aceris]|uniref:Phage tail assembly protein n=1 Tax=Rahnella sp. (strain Y9602) TaxID=2703885 RepID=A0ABW6CBZ1_RAHSY|nr:phage tail assembly protein [Rahnella aceris]MBU9864685.1 phage tail assembly protein [Rahnella aceris]VTQ52361.1 Phage tail protein E [Campylobacter jejuni]